MEDEAVGIRDPGSGIPDPGPRKNQPAHFTGLIFFP